jgi:hypothetical protein
MVDKFFDKDKPLKPTGLMGPIQLIQNIGLKTKK